VDSSAVGVVKSVGIGSVVGYYWGSDGGVVYSVVDLWEGISVVSVGVYSSIIDPLRVSFSFTFANSMDSSIGIVKWVVDSVVGYYWRSI